MLFQLYVNDLSVESDPCRLPWDAFFSGRNYTRSGFEYFARCLSARLCHNSAQCSLETSQVCSFDENKGWVWRWAWSYLWTQRSYQDVDKHCDSWDLIAKMVSRLSFLTKVQKLYTFLSSELFCRSGDFMQINKCLQQTSYQQFFRNSYMSSLSMISVSCTFCPCDAVLHKINPSRRNIQCAVMKRHTD